MLVLGDAHADDPSNRAALLAAYEAADADVALQVGDLGHYDLPVPTWFVAGNDEDFDVIEALRSHDGGLGRWTEVPDETADVHLLASDVAEVGGLRVAGLSGNFAPTRYEADRSELTGDRRRHFVRDDVERAAQLDGVDVFLTHEAPHGLLRNGGYDVGCEHVDAILEALSPDLCLVGHHHRHAESEFGETRVVALAPVWEGYYALDPADCSLERHPAPDA